MAEKDNVIRITDAGLQELPDGRVVLRGVIDAPSLRRLKFPAYQKKTHSQAKLRRLAQAVMNGSRLPDIEVGLRGSQKYESRDTTYVLFDPCYVIDGEQRRTALLAVAARHPEVNCSIGVVVNFDTTEKWERERFAALATDRTAVAPSVLLRNAAQDNRYAKMLYDLTMGDAGSILHKRVTWDQFQMQGELIRASALYRITMLLHAWMVAPRSTKPHHMIAGIEEIAVQLGPQVMLQNVVTFFELVDHYWGWRAVQKRDGGAQLSTTFLLAMAELMARLKIFWNGAMLDDGPGVRRLKSRLEITSKVRELLSPNSDARHIIISYYQTNLNRNRAQPYQERPLATRRPARDDAATVAKEAAA
jgi:hypothetical protein